MLIHLRLQLARELVSDKNVFFIFILLNKITFLISEQATDGGLPSENWALNMEICDIINETEEGPRDAIKAIKKRLTQAAGKNYTVVMYTLTVSVLFIYLFIYCKKKIIN